MPRLRELEENKQFNNADKCIPKRSRQSAMERGYCSSTIVAVTALGIRDGIIRNYRWPILKVKLVCRHAQISFACCNGAYLSGQPKQQEHATDLYISVAGCVADGALCILHHCRAANVA